MQNSKRKSAQDQSGDYSTLTLFLLTLKKVETQTIPLQHLVPEISLTEMRP